MPRDHVYRLHGDGSVEVRTIADAYRTTIARVAAGGGSFAFGPHENIVYGQDARERVVTRYDIGADRWQTPIGVGYGARGAIVASPSGRYVYSIDATRNAVAVVDLGRNARVAEVAIDGRPHTVVAAISDEGFVATDRARLAVIDPKAPQASGLEAIWPQVVATVSLQAPATVLATVPEGKLLLAVEPSAGRVEVIAAAYHAALGAIAVPNPVDAVLTPDGEEAVVVERDGTAVVVSLPGFRISRTLGQKIVGPFALLPD